MKRSLIEYENLKSNEKVYHHCIYLKRELSRKEVREIIDSIHKYYHYNSTTGILEIEYTILKEINGTKERIINMPIFIGVGLTNEEQDRVMIDSKFEYNLDTGFFTIIHKIIYT